MITLRREDGFTLVEILVTLAILGFISALIATALRLGNNMWSKAQERGQSTRSLLEAENGLTRVLTTLRPLHQPDSDELDFSGYSNSLEGVIALPDHIGLGGLYRIHLFHDPQELQLTLSLSSDFQNRQAQGDRTTVATKVERISIRYFGKSKEVSNEQWQTSWLHQKRLPKLIAIDVTLSGADTQWPEFKIAPRLEQSDWQ
ncbi:prepilin-type N-terminal cleavage/methylation domain-containing protein [Rhodomicrobium lacus]|uniref:prepilin-type N-terminal cleavage/methylation domain-containing protein n=1 Tax=Rhodomicrobium lacus TaxID=2498452 RepID=UPI000F8C64B1|nr:prepilin-type N-terminal cleavage/methylation domain-containing protein [Rhodomicrobium lacus]